MDQTKNITCDSNESINNRENYVKCDDKICTTIRCVNDHDPCVIVELLETDNHRKDGSSCVSFQGYRKYRGRLCHTVCKTWAMISFGITQTMIGLAFPDLMEIINKDVGDASWIFTAWSLGNIVGSLTAGFAYERVNKLAVLMTLSLGLAIMTGITPWCRSYPVMLCVHLLGGSFANAIHSTVTADTILLWKKEKATVLQIVHLAATVGGILSPFFAEPFLKDQQLGNKTTESTDVEIFKTNISEYGQDGVNVSRFNVNNDDGIANQIGGTQIQYAYLIAAGFTFIPVIMFVLSYIVHGNIYIEDGDKQSESAVDKKDRKSKEISKKHKFIFVIVVSVQIMLYVTMQRHTYGLLMVFAIKYLEWTKIHTSNTLAGFWIAYSVGRISVVVALRKVKEEKLYLLHFIVAFIGVTGFVVCSYLHLSIMVVMCLFISAFGNGPMLSFMLSWFSSHVMLVTGRVTGVVYVFIAIGCMAVPVISGYLMNNLSYNWYLYVLVIIMILYSIMTIILRVLYRKVNKISSL